MKKYLKLSVVLLTIIITFLVIIIFIKNKEVKNIPEKKESVGTSLPSKNPDFSEEMELKFYTFEIDKGRSIDTFITKPQGNETNLLVIFHGTTADDKKSLISAKNFLDSISEIFREKDNLMIISVAYKESDIFIGDEISEGYEFVNWLKKDSLKKFGINIDKLYLLGHSRGGYIVTVLNNMIQTNGVVANAPGPINFKRRCYLEEQGLFKIKKDIDSFCEKTAEIYGDTKENPKEYEKRSLLNYLNKQKAEILFIQGLDDDKIQLNSISQLINKLQISCQNCSNYEYLELEEVGHWSFDEIEVQEKIKDFIF